MKPTEHLLTKFAGGALVGTSPLAARSRLMARTSNASLGNQLLDLLAKKNGFYAYESSLHVFPSGECPQGEYDLLDWNAPSLWKDAYEQDLRSMLCFAENTFGEQFCISADRVGKFDPETGSVKAFAQTLDEWASIIIKNPDFHLGYSLTHAWQQKNGPLPTGKRLIPARPFVLGGDFAVANLHAMDAVEGIRSRGAVANQIKNLPDGTSIKLNVK